MSLIRSIANAIASIRASVAEVGKSATIACWGDSLTAGSGGTPYPTQLAALVGAKAVNGGVAGETSTQIKTRMLSDAANRPAQVIIWAGRNNVGAQATVMADIAAMVASLGHDNYLVLTILNQDTAAEYAGGATYAQIAAINAAILATYGTRALDIRATLVAAYNPGVPQDVIDHGHDVPPSSLRFDALHLNTAGYALVASTIAAKLAAPLSVGKVLTTTLMRYLFASPPCDIGTVAPVAVKATGVNLGPFTLAKSADNNLELGAAVLPLTDYTYNLGSLARRWAQVWVAQSVRLGAAGAASVAAAADGSVEINAAVIPDADYSRNLGSLARRWAQVWVAQSVRLGTDGGVSVSTSPDGNMQVNAAVLPATDYTYNLGSLTRRWALAWLASGVRFGNGDVKLTAGGDNASLLSDGDLIPAADGTRYLGRPTFQWQYVCVSTAVMVGGVQVIAARQTGWTAGTGTPNKGAFDADTATAAQAAQRVLALEQAMRAHGLIN